MVRCGCAVYGLSPWQQDALAEGLQPALSWKSQVVLVKRVPTGEGVGYGHTFRPEHPTDVALVPIGYGDGVFSALGNHGRGAHQRPPLPDGRAGLHGLLRRGRGHRWRSKSATP